MKALALALLAVSLAAALLAALWLRHDDTAAGVESSPRFDESVTQVPARDNVADAQRAAVLAAHPSAPVTGEDELFERIDEESYTQGGGVFVDHLVKRGLARSDAERIVRESVRESTACLRDALRVEAEAQGVD